MLGTLFGIVILYQVRTILVSLFLSLIIMSALGPAVNILEKKKVPRALAIVWLYLCVFGVLALLFSLVVPPLAGELANMIRYLQPASLPKELTEFKFTIQDFSSILGQVGRSLNSVLSVITTTFSSIFFLFTLLVMSFYMLLEQHSLHRMFFWIPHTKKFEEISQEFLDTLSIQLGGWVRGEVVLMLSIGFTTYLGLWVLGIPYALPLAVLAGFLELLPNIGPTVSAIPAILITFILLTPSMALIVMIMYIAIQQLENNFLVPKIMKAAVNVEPLVSIVLILVGAQLGHVTGALLAIPIFIVMRTAVQIYLRETKQLIHLD